MNRKLRQKLVKTASNIAIFVLAVGIWLVAAGDEVWVKVVKTNCPINTETGVIIGDGSASASCLLVEDMRYPRYQYALIINEFGVFSAVFQMDTETGTLRLVWNILPKYMYRINTTKPFPHGASRRGPMFF